MDAAWRHATVGVAVAQSVQLLPIPSDGPIAAQRGVRVAFATSHAFADALRRGQGRALEPGLDDSRPAATHGFRSGEPPLLFTPPAPIRPVAPSPAPSLALPPRHPPVCTPPRLHLDLPDADRRQQVAAPSSSPVLERAHRVIPNLHNEVHIRPRGSGRIECSVVRHRCGRFGC